MNGMINGRKTSDTLKTPGARSVTHLVWMRMSALVGFSINLQISSCVTGIAVLLDTHRSER